MPFPEKPEVEFTDPQKVIIRRHRWVIEISIVDALGQDHEYIASADSYLTEHDRIWFGTSEEADEAMQ